MIRATARSAPDRQDEISKLVSQGRRRNGTEGLICAVRNGLNKSKTSDCCFLSDEKCQLQHRPLCPGIWSDGERRDDGSERPRPPSTFHPVRRQGRSLRGCETRKYRSEQASFIWQNTSPPLQQQQGSQIVATQHTLHRKSTLMRLLPCVAEQSNRHADPGGVGHEEQTVPHRH